MTGPVRVVVTGSREWTDRRLVRQVLVVVINRLEAEGVVPDRRFVVVVHGAQGRRDPDTGTAVRGLDVIADDVARDLGMGVDPWPADWARHGRAGGPIRNRGMVDSVPRPVWCLGFPLPGSVGTWGCMSYALSRGLRVFNCSHGELLEVTANDDGQTPGPGDGGVAGDSGTARRPRDGGRPRDRRGQNALW